MDKIIQNRCPEGDWLVLFHESNDGCTGCSWYDTCKKEEEKMQHSRVRAIRRVRPGRNREMEKEREKKQVKKIYESWDDECLQIHRLRSGNLKMTFDEAHGVFNEDAKLKGFVLLKSRWLKRTELPEQGMRVSESVFVRSSV